MRIYFEVDIPEAVGSFDAESRTGNQWLVQLRRYGAEDGHAGALIRTPTQDPFEVIRLGLNAIHQQGGTQ
jgi:hypothetical protein